MEDTKPSKYGKFPEAEVEQLRAQLGLDSIIHLANLDTDHEVLCRPVEEPEFLRFQGWVEDKAQRDLAPQRLVRLVLLKHDPRHPDVDHMFRKFPGLGDTFAGELLRLAGMGKRTVGKAY